MNSNYSQDELEILRSIENGEWESVERVEEEKKRYQEYAGATLRKDRRVNIRIAERDLKNCEEER